MTPSQALDIIAARYGRGSRQHTTACIYLARGQASRVVTMAATTQGSVAA